MCEAGYASSLAEARELNVRELLQALHRIEFKAVYNETEWELNKLGEA